MRAFGSAPVGWPGGAELAGTVYRYARQGDGSWAEADRIQASDARMGDQFGRSIWADASTLVVGAPGNGAAYVFEKNDSGTWHEAGKLMPSALEEEAEFGGANQRGGLRTAAIAVTAGRIAVTSYNSVKSSGNVHVFHRMGDVWMEEAVLQPDHQHDESGFGYAIAAEAGRFFVGAIGEDEYKGAVYVFTEGGAGQWNQEQRITLENAQGRVTFGRALATQGGRLYAGAPGFQRAGAVVAFDRVGDAWEETARYLAPAADEGETGRVGFGNAVAVSGSQLLISATETVLAHDLNAPTAPPFIIEPQDDRSRASFGVGVGVSGDVAVIGSPGADYESGFATLYGYAAGAWSPVSILLSDVASFASISGSEVECEDGSAEGFDCENIDLVSFISVQDISTERGVKLTDIWGWEDPVTGKEWVLQARTDGVSFVDISNSGHPIFVGELLRTKGSPGSSWRDVKVYKDHAFIVADGSGEHGVQIFDLGQLRAVAPQDMPVRFEETAHYSGVHSTHNIVINEATGFAYAVGNRAGGETCDGQLHMINIQDPVHPQFAGCFSRESAGGTHDAQCVIYRGDDVDYAGREICLNSNSSSFIIADVTDKDNPVTLAQTTYPNLNYTHQGWLTEDQRYFLMGDELDETNFGNNTRTLVWDVMDLDDPVLLTEYFGPNHAITHNIYTNRGYAYLANYSEGLRILDIADINNPVQVAFFDTQPVSDETAFNGAWSSYPYLPSGNVLVSSMYQGFFILRPTMIPVATETSEIPSDFALSQNFPNPFNPSTVISYTLSRQSDVQLSVVDVLGRLVRVLDSGIRPPGQHEIEFDATGLPSGTYFYRLKAGGSTKTKSMTIVK